VHSYATGRWARAGGEPALTAAARGTDLLTFRGQAAWVTGIRFST